MESVVLDKIKGSLYGFVIGDALGVPVEFMDRAQLAKNPVKDMIAGGTHSQPAGTWSDDTSMMLATMDSMCQNKDLALGKVDRNEIFDYNDVMRRFLNWYKKADYTSGGVVFDIGNATADALRRYEADSSSPFCGSDSLMSNGNGSLMRILPLALYSYFCSHPSVEMTIYDDNYDITKRLSSLTHANIISVMGCFIYKELITYYLIGGDSLMHFNADRWNTSKAYSSMRGAMQIRLGGKIQKDFGDLELCREYYQRLVDDDITKLSADEVKSSGFVVDTLEAAIWCALTSENFEIAVLKAVNLGNDTDTIGALTGGLAGLFFGLDSIPQKWLDAIQNKEYLDNQIKNFTDLLEERQEMNDQTFKKMWEEYEEKRA